MPRPAWLIGSLALILLVVASIDRDRSAPSLLGRDTSASSSSEVAGLVNAADKTGVGQGNIATEQDRSVGAGVDQLHATTIRRPAGPPRVEFETADPQGRRGGVACSTCHSVREPDPTNRTPADLDQFHQDMPMAHGELACYACHHPADADRLRLADSTSIEYADVMKLCAQCHGPQARDYQHGAHGGMNGYWDLSRGPRTRNHCIDCHDPHVPAFPKMQPTFKPRDRFLSHHAPGAPHRTSSDREVDDE